MFDSEKMYIKEIQSVIYVKSGLDSKRRNFYGALNRYELIYKLSGENITRYQGVEMKNTPGTVEYLFKSEVSDYTVDIVEPGDCIDIFFDTDYPMPKEAFCIATPAGGRVGELFSKLYQVWVSRQSGYYHKCLALFYEILSELMRIDIAYVSGEKFKRILPGIDYLNCNCFNKSIDYYEPARLCGMSYSYFKRLFYKKYSATPIHYVTKRRMEHAVELLSTEMYGISKIAELCGYDSVYYFSSVFKKSFGVSPKNYKQIKT